MRLVTPLLRTAAVFVAVAILAGCEPPPSPVTIKAPKEIDGPSDLVATKPRDPHARSFQLRAFQLNHVWSGAGHPADDGLPYRSKVTLWDFADDGSAVAELYLYDNGAALPQNPDPKDAKRPYALRFPIGAVGPIMQALRNANEPVYLFYYDGQWAIGINGVEAVGVD
jgi:hypothetical protein